MIQPLIIGHRGASAVAPENTVVAFESALAGGADGIEFDVQLASDGVPVVIHDSTLNRTGLRTEAIGALTSTELAGINVGLWFNQRYPERARPEYADATVPTLATVLELLRDSAAVLYVEMKCKAEQSRKLAEKVAELIRLFDLCGRAVAVSFSLDAIKEIKHIEPAVRTGALFEPTLSRRLLSKRALIESALRYEADEILWHRTLASVKWIEEAKQRGLASVVWTVDDDSWIARAIKYGVRAVITNHPAKMRVELDRLSPDKKGRHPKSSLT